MILHIPSSLFLLLLVAFALVIAFVNAFHNLSPPSLVVTHKKLPMTMVAGGSRLSHLCHATSSISSTTRRDYSSLILLSLSSSNSDNDDSSNDVVGRKRRRKRVKRKNPVVATTTAAASAEKKEVVLEESMPLVNDADDDEDNDATILEEDKIQETPSPTVVPDLQPRDDTPVELTIMDVRDVVSGTQSLSSSSDPQGGGDSSQKQVLLSSTSTESPTSAVSATNVGGSNNRSSGDSLQQILADAKAMRQDDGNDDRMKGDTAASSSSIGETVRNVLSTIVTIDFFVVCALLVWFLAGIFGSYVLKNDAIQIAFNSIFQQVVQPALGILMIGSAASAVLKEGDEE